VGPGRDALLADTNLKGAGWCRAYSDAVDAWLAGILHDSEGDPPAGIALVAVGGYGRAELCPESDIDLMLLHDKRPDIAELANRIWYPIWDAGLKLGHSVCTRKEALALVDNDLDTATAVLSARHVAGDKKLTERLAADALTQWERRSKRWLTELGSRVDARHEKAGEVAFSLEPDLKEGRGGLRDVHSLHWAETAHRILLEHDSAALQSSYASLLDARVELQRLTRRPTNILVVQNRDAVAAALGLGDSDAMMAGLAEAARTITWTSDDTWRRIRSSLRGPLGRVNRRPADLGPGLRLLDGEVHLDLAADPRSDATLALRAATAAATNHTVIDRQSLERLAEGTPELPDPWPADALRQFLALLLAGPSAIGAIEALDQRGVWRRILPEWIPVRARPQRNAFHRFTVDRHLLEATANAAALSARVERPDLLAVAALLHDLGKGYPGDHSEVGAEMAERITTRMGFPPEDVETVSMLVRHHLLLSEVATRRDLDDPVTTDRVVEAVGDVARLHLLAALTEADSMATGPAAWSPWKAGLLDRLVKATEHALGGGDARLDGDGNVVADDAAGYQSFPGPDLLAKLAEGGRHFDTSRNVLTVMTDDRPGIFSRVAGVLALHGLDVLEANAYSTEGAGLARADLPARADPSARTAARAVARFRINDPVRSEPPWDRVLPDLELALDGRLALNARLAERARIYARDRAIALATTAVTIDNGASAKSTVVDVHTANGIGVLYRITRALTELELDIRSARIGTIGDYVYDAFYVRDATGEKITDPQSLTEIQRALVHSLTSS